MNRSDLKSVKLLEQLMPNGIVRSFTMNSAYDLTKAEDGKNYGIHGAEMRFCVQRGKVAVTLYWMTPFHLPHVRQELNGKPYLTDLFDGLGGIDYHTAVPLYEGRTPVKNCEYTGGDCYGDGSSLAAGELFDKAVRDPEEIWRTLEEWLLETEQLVAEQQENARNFS